LTSKERRSKSKSTPAGERKINGVGNEIGVKINSLIHAHIEFIADIIP
jgi:hypothetical protein